MWNLRAPAYNLEGLLCLRLQLQPTPLESAPPNEATLQVSITRVWWGATPPTTVKLDDTTSVMERPTNARPYLHVGRLSFYF